ncbi:MAG TPA: hypothetical protein VGD64_12930 [Acidisarcina sp.]
MILNKLKKSFTDAKPNADKFRETLAAALSALMEGHALPLATPIEHRTKDWISITRSVDAHSADLDDDVRKIGDFVGLRLVFLFSDEAEQACKLIKDKFDLIHQANKGEELKPEVFGYRSVHLDVRLKKDAMPFYDFVSYRAEIQVRTLAQHCWAAASHQLQYKDEAGVPLPVQRSLYRVAALLEVVGLELDRVLREKQTYAQSVAADWKKQEQSRLNVDLLVSVLKRDIPPVPGVSQDLLGSIMVDLREDLDDPYAALLHDLEEFGILTVKQLSTLIQGGLSGSLKAEEAVITLINDGDGSFGGVESKIAQGVFYTRAGLVRSMILPRSRLRSS